MDFSYHMCLIVPNIRQNDRIQFLKKCKSKTNWEISQIYNNLGRETIFIEFIRPIIEKGMIFQFSILHLSFERNSKKINLYNFGSLGIVSLIYTKWSLTILNGIFSKKTKQNM